MIVIACTFVGYAAQKVANYETSGFMNSYDGFVKGEEDQKGLVSLPKKGALRKYDKVLIDHVVVYFLESSKSAGIDPSKLNQLCDLFHKELIGALETCFTVADKPGEGVLFSD